MPHGDLERNSASDTAYGEDEWFWARHGTHGPLGPGPESRFGLGLVAGEMDWERSL